MKTKSIRPPISEDLYSDWSLSKPLHLSKKDDRYKAHLDQLKQHGFSDSETWSLYSVMCDFILPRLTRFKDIVPNHPSKITLEEWKIIIDKMRFSFYYAKNRDEDEFTDKFEDERQADYEQYEEGMQLFSKWFQHLWW